MAEKGAEVRIPPPLVYAAPLLLSGLLDRAVPLRLPDMRARRALGWALVAAGALLGNTGAATFLKHRTTVIPQHAVRTMVTSGPYAYTRNPMYVGLTVAYAGGSLLLGSWWPVIALPAVVAYVDRNVIRHEETYLRARFGDEYDTYTRHTRRWL